MEDIAGKVNGSEGIMEALRMLGCWPKLIPVLIALVCEQNSRVPQGTF